MKNKDTRTINAIAKQAEELYEKSVERLDKQNLENTEKIANVIEDKLKYFKCDNLNIKYFKSFNEVSIHNKHGEEIISFNIRSDAEERGFQPDLLKTLENKIEEIRDMINTIKNNDLYRSDL